MGTLIDLGIGIAIGAAFSPFWMMVWNLIKAKYAPKVEQAVEDAAAKK